MSESLVEMILTEEVVAPVVQAPVEAPAIAPVVDAPVIAPVETTVVEAPKVDAPAETPIEAKPLLAQAEETAPVEVVKTEGADKPLDAPVEPIPLPVYEFNLPEGAEADNPRFKSFQTKLGEFQNLSKAEQAAVQKFGQEMIDMHIEDTKTVVESLNKSNWDWFNNRNKEWLETAKKDPSIGGDNWDSTVSSAQQAISLYGGNKSQQIEVAKMLQETGVENHPALLRFLSNITKIAAKEGSPVSSQSAPVQKAGIAQSMYGNSPVRA